MNPAVNPRRRFVQPVLLAAFLMLAVGLVASPVFADRTMFSDLTGVEEIRERITRLPESGQGRTKAKLWSDLGTSLYKRGEMTEAAGAFEEALAHRTTARIRRHVYLFLGKSYESTGRLDKAIAAYEEALHHDPRHWRRHRDLAGLYAQAKLFRKARDLYASARRLQPREPSVWFDSATVLRKMGLYQESSTLLGRAEELGHDSHAVQRERSLILEGQGRFPEALESWRRGADESADLGDIARSLYLAVLAGAPDRANESLRRLRAGGAAKETLQLYENLVELPPFGPESLLSREGKYLEMEAMVASFLARERTP